METNDDPQIRAGLCERQMMREKTFNDNKERLEKMRNEKKGTRYRKWLYNYLEAVSKMLFNDIDEEYKVIGKFGRGAWDEGKFRNTFKNKEEEKFMIEIAKQYGAFDF